MFILMEDLCVTFLLAQYLFLLRHSPVLLPHPANFTPIAAMALAGGVYFNRRFALVIPLAALVLSDVFLGFHNTMFFVYGSFVVIGLIGLWLQSHKKPIPIIGAALFSSILVLYRYQLWSVGDRRRLVLSKKLAGVRRMLHACYTVFPQYRCGRFNLYGSHYSGYLSFRDIL